MKTVQDKHTGSVVRVPDNAAEDLVLTGRFAYVPKSVWKIARKLIQDGDITATYTPQMK